MEKEKETMKELNRNIFSNDNAKKIYNNSKVKARNFLTNVSYCRIAAADFNNSNFVIDCFTFMILYMNPFYLERKFESVIEREFVNVLWAYLMPNSLYVYISNDTNMKTLNKIRTKYHDAKDIIIEFLKKDSTNLNILSDFLQKNAILYQYLFGNLFPKCFSRVSDYGIDAKTLFNKYYHSFQLQKNMLHVLKEEPDEGKEQKQEQEQEHKLKLESPINMTTLFDVNNDDDNDDDNDNDNDNDNNDDNRKNDDENKENIAPMLKTKQVKRKISKRKIKDTEEKKQKREAKKKKLLEQLNENTKQMLKIKGKK